VNMTLAQGAIVWICCVFVFQRKSRDDVVDGSGSVCKAALQHGCRHLVVWRDFGRARISSRALCGIVLLRGSRHGRQRTGEEQKQEKREKTQALGVRFISWTIRSLVKFEICEASVLSSSLNSDRQRSSFSRCAKICPSVQCLLCQVSRERWLFCSFLLKFFCCFRASRRREEPIKAFIDSFGRHARCLWRRNTLIVESSGNWSLGRRREFGCKKRNQKQ
jgi:hypothetical protein